MRKFKTSWFAHFASKNNISEETLKIAATEIEQGRFEADLGGGVIKKRLARPGQGKSGGYRLIVCFKKGTRLFFVYAYPKSVLYNISQTDLQAFKKFANDVFMLPDKQLEQEIEDGLLHEIMGE